MGLAYQPYKLTVQDYELLPEDKRVELIDGDFLMSPSPNPKHQRISREIEIRLVQWVKEHRLGEVFYAPMDVVLSENDLVQPDLLFITEERLRIIGDKNIQGPPDLVIEILSPNYQKRDLFIKRHLYSKFAVPEYWIVDPEAETITLLVFEKDRLEVKQTFPKNAVLHSTVVKDFKLSLDEIFNS